MNPTVATILAAVLAVTIPVLRAYLLTTLTKRIPHISEIARVAVRAAEQLGTDVPGTTGEAKLNYAAEVVVSGAKRLGIKLSKDEVLAFVHAALREMKQVDSFSPAA